MIFETNDWELCHFCNQDDTDEISGVVARHCAANGGRTVAVAVNFSDRLSRLPGAVLILVAPASKSVAQTDFLLQGGPSGSRV